MSLDQEIHARRTEIRSDGYPMSIGELINIYKDGELDIHPEFQRYYRWSDDQKSRLVESILLGIPIPSIFVSQRHDGVWDVIDGLQRLSTILELVGQLKDASGKTIPPLTLKRTKYLPSLEGTRWEDDDPSRAIGAHNQLIIRRAKIDIHIVLRESSESSKYELFQRLNTGGSQLSEQELRNDILIMVSPDAFRWIQGLAKDENFQYCIGLSDRLLNEQYDLDLVTRFVGLRNLTQEQLQAIGDIGDFLTDRIVELAQFPDFENHKSIETEAFTRTFECLSQSLGDRSFRKYDIHKQRYLGGFLISAFEPIALGIGYNYKHYNSDSQNIQKIEQLTKDLWASIEFLSHSGMGVRASTRLPSNIPLGRSLFGP